MANNHDQKMGNDLPLSTVHMTQNEVHDLVIDISQLSEERAAAIEEVKNIDADIRKINTRIYNLIGELGQV